MSSSPSPGRRSGRGSGRGRGRGRGGRRGGRGRSNRRADSGNYERGNSNRSNSTSIRKAPVNMPDMRDEEILIAFMPYLKGDNNEAMTIHELYQERNDQQAFLSAARDFLAREAQRKAARGFPSTHGGDSTSLARNGSPMPTAPPTDSNSGLPLSPPRQGSRGSSHWQGQGNDVVGGNPTSQIQRSTHTNDMESLEQNMANLLSDDDDPVISMPSRIQHSNAVSAIGRGVGSLPTTTLGTAILAPSPPRAESHLQPHMQQPYPFQNNHHQNLNAVQMTPPRGIGDPHTPNSTAPASPFSSLFPPTNTASANTQSTFLQQQVFSPQRAANDSSYAAPPPPGIPTPTHGTAPKSPIQTPPMRPSQSASILETPVRATPPATPATEATKATKKEYQPRRLWTHLDQQPGELMANNVPNSSMGNVVDLRPRQELKAQWMLPLSYLRERAASKGEANTLRGLVANLAVGLFRRGCTENGAQASIVSKEILTPKGESRSDYPFQVLKNNMVVGTVPFYSPRTPGHVVLRLYWQDNPLHTLATGPTLNVRVTENDFESAIRFILSNFKAKKVNPTSLSSLNSFALVLEQFQLSPNTSPQSAQHKLDGAGRAVWGCICEARKVLDACASEYHKTTTKLEKLEVVVEELKAKVEEEEQEILGSDINEDKEKEELTENAVELREKQRALISGRASCERKWRDSQLAFSSILKAIVTNRNLSILLRRELITKMRLEFELWCPLCEEFAVPGDAEGKMWYEPLKNLPHTVTSEHFRFCAEARSEMQIRILGFDPNTTKLEHVLYPSRGRNREMDPGAVNVFNQLSGAMGKLYQEVYATADRILQQREMIRSQTEKFVSMCEVFPPGTKVAVFGSSANGFGSPMSDLDMCLQIPDGALITSEEDPTGAHAMGKLALMLEQNGMKEVDTCRLTARIPVIKFNCPKPLEDGTEGEDALMECDLSMHNPLAVLNTGLLRSYAEINPVSRVLASVIKRWAKARDINNPARHTLSSYGYILMLLHFLTFHQRSGNGLVSPLNEQKSVPAQVLPLLPNLQWMDAAWPSMNPGTPYKEYDSLPKNQIKHPLEERANVNMYFYRPNAAMLNNLQRLFPGQDLSLGILLASFFRYYAFEFDYKRHVVSLHSTNSQGVVEREVKAELDGWRNYSAALTIEDPFETFYDVAHVLRGGYYHRIRREFALAYSKIADIASGRTNSSWGNKPVDLTKMSGMELVDWICEPIATEKDEASSN